jgi:hypothetical protein
MRRSRCNSLTTSGNSEGASGAVKAILRMEFKTSALFVM